MTRRPLLRKILARPSLLVGSLIVLGFFAMAISAPLLAPGEERGAIPRKGVGVVPEPPQPGHPLGLMPDKYDVFYGLVWGTRTAFLVGLSISLSRALIGVVVGLVSGSFGGLVDAVVMRLTDAFMAFPIMAAAMLGLAALPLQQTLGLVLVLILFGWMPYARLTRGNVLTEREKAYVQAARATGSRTRRILFRHLLPNSTHGLFVLVTSDIGAVVVLFAAFTFLRLIGNYDTLKLMQADWGQMLSNARNWIIGAPDQPFQYWYTYIPVSAAIVLFAAGWNLIGDGLRDVLDPHLR
jgi:peptide/nickel transport system permease protein